MRELYLSLADVLNNDAHNTSITEEQPADNTTSLCSVVSIWNEASAATDANLLQHHHLTAQKYWLPSWLACCRLATSTTATTKNVRIIVLPSHRCRGTLQNLYLILLHSSMQTSADHQSGQCQVNRMTDEKGETWSPFGMSKVRSRPESLVADCSMPALQPPERRGRQG